MNRYRFPSLPALGAWAAVLMAFLLLSACGSQSPGPPDALFLNWDDFGRVQLLRLPVSSDEPARSITGKDPSLVGDVTTFSVAPDGSRIAYSILLDSGDSEIRLINPGTGQDELAMACPAAECGELNWAPDSRRLVYERRDLSGAAAGQPQIWWLESDTGETVPLVEDDSGPTYGASFSPDGQWLAYVSTKDQGIVVVNLLDGFQRLIATDTGMPPRWSLDSQSLVYSARELLVLHGEEGDDHDSHGHDFGSAILLYVQDMSDETTAARRLSPDAAVDDSSPSLSPDGQWLVIGRRVPDTASGRQLWLMRADGSEARALTADPGQHYGPATWSPDGQFLLYQRYPTAELNANPSIWMLEINSGVEQQLAESGFTPAWLTVNE